MPWLRSLAAVLLCTAFVSAGDWPQWLGPQRDGSSPEKVAPWKDELKVLWRAPLGEGHGSAVVADGKVYIHVKVNNKDQEEVIAFDAVSGKELWRTPYERGFFGSVFGNGPRATPAVSDGRVYSFGATGILTCFDAAKGTQLWQVNTLKEFKAANLFFGTSSSPLVEGDKVLVNVGGKGASIVAFGKDKGDVVWKALDDKASYSSGIAITADKQRQVIFLTAGGLASLNPSDGGVFWQFPLVDKLSESSTTPVRIGDILLGSSVTYGSVGLHLEAKDGKPAATEAWKNDTLTCYFSTPVAVGKEHVYLVTGGIIPPPSATLRCVDVKSGKELWNKPKVGKYHAALLRTGDDKLLMLDDAGSLILLEPNAKEYKELARAKVCGQTWATPALANGRLYLRDAKDLICLELSAPK
jgi:outer membrane protein assembly factor BamB